MVKRTPIRIRLVRMLSLLALLALTACTPPEAVSVPPTQPASAEILRVSLEEARAVYDNGQALFLDVRSVSSYANSHIPGALSIPLGELETRKGSLDPKQWIIPYCT